MHVPRSTFSGVERCHIVLDARRAPCFPRFRLPFRSPGAHTPSPARRAPSCAHTQQQQQRRSVTFKREAAAAQRSSSTMAANQPAGQYQQQQPVVVEAIPVNYQPAYQPCVWRSSLLASRVASMTIRDDVYTTKHPRRRANRTDAPRQNDDDDVRGAAGRADLGGDERVGVLRHDAEARLVPVLRRGREHENSEGSGAVHAPLGLGAVLHRVLAVRPAPVLHARDDGLRPHLPQLRPRPRPQDGAVIALRMHVAKRQSTRSHSTCVASDASSCARVGSIGGGEIREAWFHVVVAGFDQECQGRSTT